ncbi:CRISPR-associated endoribonuclease Cas2 [Bombiscardovia apis]|uniref:CRISPR-associated endoribonuclease Cas2 n=1 Tax=Bombiscardovia apis TaxID=2932182 RepID=A0ABM8BE87_9BIFI|nr:CRISPR-associated endonuclease Cas2 [Bombiscardovia apis]BDR55225.1 CRISPR-associated endoribonuclease Cas2 [Bombiscardovia apis]
MMMVVVAYDVNTEEPAGRRRLRLVAKACMKFGQRVQNSIFECLISTSDLLILRQQLLDIIDDSKDSLRFYNMGAKYSGKIEQYGVERHLPADSVMII